MDWASEVTSALERRLRVLRSMMEMVALSACSATARYFRLRDMDMAVMHADSREHGMRCCCLVSTFIMTT